MKTAYLVHNHTTQCMIALTLVREIPRKVYSGNRQYHVVLSISISLTLDSVFEDKSYLNYIIILCK